MDALEMFYGLYYADTDKKDVSTFVNLLITLRIS